MQINLHIVSGELLVLHFAESGFVICYLESAEKFLKMLSVN